MPNSSLWCSIVAHRGLFAAALLASLLLALNVWLAPEFLVLNSYA